MPKFGENTLLGRVFRSRLADLTPEIAGRFVGATVTGAPTEGTFRLGDFVVSQDGNILVCIVAGSPGTWVAIGLSVVLPINIESVDPDPSPPAAGSLNLYPRTTSGRLLWRAKGPVGKSYALQPSFFSVAATLIQPGTGTTLGTFGTGVTSTGTVGHGGGSQALGFYSSLTSGAVAGNTGSTGHQFARWRRGNVEGSNGFFYKCRFCLPDAAYGAGATGARFFVGLTGTSIASALAADDPGSAHAAFTFSTNLGDTTWKFAHAQAAGSVVYTETGVAFVAQHVYDAFVFCEPQGGVIYWRIDDLTSGASAEGSVNAPIPSATTDLRGGLGVATLSALARSIGLLGLYCESDV